MEPETYTYLYLSRPPAYAHQPDRQEDGLIEYGGPGIQTRMRRWNGVMVYAFGRATYRKPLPLDRAWRFDLMPDHPVVWAITMIWLDNNRDERATLQDLDEIYAGHYDRYDSELIYAANILVNVGIDYLMEIRQLLGLEEKKA
jgi:hypothetical protein